MLLDAETAAQMSANNQYYADQLHKVDALIREAIFEGEYFVRTLVSLSGLVQNHLNRKGYTLEAVPEIGGVSAHIIIRWSKKPIEHGKADND